MKKIIVIAGPTAVGKTALSIQLAKEFNGEIISGDSMQVYTGLDIGTAKVTKAEQAGIAHHLIDCRQLEENYSVADFQKEGRQAIEAIVSKGKLPIVVGGTGLYLQALLYDFELGSKDEDPQVREAYEQFLKENSPRQLWELLNEKDEQAAKAIHYNNTVKVIRALEVYDKTGYSILTPKEKPKPLYDYFLIGLETDRQVLYNRINQRVNQMLEHGILAEAKQLYTRQEVQATQGIGYKEFFPYFDGTISLDEAVQQVKQNSRRYAKRQLTWFKNRMQAQWWDLVAIPENTVRLKQEIAQWLITSEGSADG